MSLLNNGATDSMIVEQQLARNAIAENKNAAKYEGDFKEEPNGGQEKKAAAYVQKNKKPIMDQTGPQRDMEYQELVNERTLKHNLFVQMLHAES